MSHNIQIPAVTTRPSAPTRSTAGELAALLLANSLALIGLVWCGIAYDAASNPPLQIWFVLGLG